MSSPKLCLFKSFMQELNIPERGSSGSTERLRRLKRTSSSYQVTEQGELIIDGIRITSKGIQATQNPRHIDDLCYENLVILKTLGEGAFGAVRKVYHRLSKQMYAMKVVPLDNNNMKTKSIVAEFKSLFSCNCPHVLTMHDAFYREGRIYLMLENMKCGSLLNVVEKCGKIPESVLAKIAAQLLKGLHYIHTKKGIVHRDIKPDNILVNTNGIVKIADFGHSGHKDWCKTSSNGFTTFQGTTTYMSPERLRGEPHSFNSDIWSLGLTLAQCALGKFPYELEEHTMWEMLQIHASKNGAVQLSPEEFSKEFRSFVSECMTADSSKRPSAEQLLNHDFIVKNTNSNPSIERWLYENFAVQKRDGMKS